MKVTNTLRKVRCACRNILAMICLCGMSSLLFTACDPYNTEENIDPVYAVDLGLSVKWAWCNVGASLPEEYGHYFAWGELTQKYSFDRSNYALYNSNQNSYVDVGKNISGTVYDVARYRLGDDWRLPTEEEVQELKDKCKWEKSSLNGVDGMFVTGPNGNRIFLPNANNGYWSGTYASESYGYKYSQALTWNYSVPWLNGNSADVKVKEMTCYSGLAVRPVKGELKLSDEESDTEKEESSNKTYTVNGVSFRMISVEGGTFSMGSPDTDKDAWDNEKPAHQVTLSGYYIGETEVTQALWQAVMGSNPSKFTGDLQRPVEMVSRDDCQTFIKKLNQLTGETFRLPTEAEWEYAARGGKESQDYKYSGNDSIDDVAWYWYNSSDGTKAVKAKQPNELGIYDMSGNVWEWCYDWHGASFYSSSVQTNPTGPLSGSIRVLRGGSWYTIARGCRVANRSGSSSDSRCDYYGLRLVLSSIVMEDDPVQEPITIATGEASAITSESATLSGVVSGATNEISCGIIYGTSSDMSSLNNNRVETSSDGAYSVNVSNLQLGTTYYYCAYAIIDGKEQYGEVLSFTTLQISIDPVEEFKIYNVNGVSFTMIGVEGGVFTMGSLNSDGDANSGEKPAHQVTLSSYYMGETEVTQALWQAVMGSNPSYYTGDLQRPVESVSWNDCQDFINRLNELTGENFRLPTEAEWEYAARGGKYSKGYKYSGSNTIGDVAWYGDNSWGGTKAVKTKQPNELGIYDMSGNVLEWCYDWYGGYSYSAQTDPTGPSSGSSRVLRGGSWGYVARGCRVAYRDNYTPDGRGYDSGFRLAISSTERDDDFVQEPVITITTGEASAVSFGGATLSGVVSGAIDEISCGIIYGTSSDMSSLNNNRVATSSKGAYSIDVSNLQSGITYYYCAYAIIDGKEQYGEVRTFTTPQSESLASSKTYTVNGVSFTMIGVEGGTFTMGLPDSDSDADSNEQPAHQVTLSSYYIGETVVTQALWRAVMGSNPSYYTGDLQRPVDCVSWDDCQTFIDRLNELTGESFRLPTEAEWEYAARGGKESKGYKYSGSNTIDDVAWYDDNSSNTTHAVKTKQSNELGIYDMSGNVWEWCSDWYDAYSSSPQTNPTGPSSGSYRVLRGGSWYSSARDCRVAIRGSNPPDSRHTNFGFRLFLQFIP